MSFMRLVSSIIALFIVCWIIGFVFSFSVFFLAVGFIIFAAVWVLNFLFGSFSDRKR